jgi:hypothetical protein
MQNNTASQISLRGVPSGLLDSSLWADILSFAETEIRALQLLNAPHPDGPFKDYWNTYPEGEFRRQRIHQAGRELSVNFRQLMGSGELVALGYAPGSAVRARIPVDRDDLWPRFWTEKIAGPDIEFTAVTVIEAAKMSSPRLTAFRAAMDFIQDQNIMGQPLTKRFKGEVEAMFPTLTRKEVDVLWALVSGRKPGRPPGNN